MKENLVRELERESSELVRRVNPVSESSECSEQI